MITLARIRQNHLGSLRVIAAIIEHHGHFCNMEVSLRSKKSPLPKLLHRAYGGTYFIHRQANGSTCQVFRIRGKGAAKLLNQLAPFFLFRRPEVQRLLRAYFRVGRG